MGHETTDKQHCFPCESHYDMVCISLSWVKWEVCVQLGTELANLLNIVSFLCCTFFLFIPAFSPGGIKVKYSVKELLDVEERDGGREGRRKYSADLSVRLPAEKLSTLCFGKVINFSLFCYKTASHFLCCRFIGTFGHTLSSSAQSKYNSYFFRLYSSKCSYR